MRILPLIVSAALAAGCALTASAPGSGADAGAGSGAASADGSAGGSAAAAGAPQRLKVEVLEVRPHDRTAFTQGFELADGVLYEGTGLVGRSAILATDPVTGAVQRRVDLPQPLFGEGITVVGPRIWQLTWRNGVAIEWDRAALTELRRVPYTGEGWGLCHDGTRLVMSDGTDRLRFRSPATFDEVGEVRVRRTGGPVGQLNELECAGGAVWANVWKTDHILRIDPASGLVTAVVDASGLLAAHGSPAGADVLNGIAALPGGTEFLITGKHWPYTFRVQFTPA